MQAEAPKPAQVMNRGDGGIIRLRSPFGDMLDIEVNQDPTLLQLRHELATFLPGVTDLTFKQGDELLTEGSAIDTDQPVEFTYPLQGGGPALVFVRTIPEAIRLHILCCKIGLQQVGNLANTAWCMSTCCCLFQACGTLDMLRVQQFFCLKVGLSPVGCNCITTMPACLQLKCLCCSCGIKNFPDIKNDDWVTESILCCYSNCGPKECCAPQVCCLKCTC